MVIWMNKLYIVPTPIGNLEDMSLRGIRILKEVSLIAAEDTRHSRRLLEHFGINTPMTSYYEYNKHRKISYIMGKLRTDDVALISDAGTPTISDPGFELVSAAIDNGFQVIPLPGPSAVTVALSASGIATKAFTFLGFLQRNHREKVNKLLAEYRNREETLILYESPQRLVNTLTLLLNMLGNRYVVVALELTKMFEEIRRGPLDEMIKHFETNPVKGEVTIVLGRPIQEEKVIWSEKRVISEFRKLLENGEKRSIAAKTISKRSGWSRQRIYAKLEDK